MKHDLRALTLVFIATFSVLLLNKKNEVTNDDSSFAKTDTQTAAPLKKIYKARPVKTVTGGSRLPSSLPPAPAQVQNEELKVQEYLKIKTKQNWTLEKNKSHIVSLYGNEKKGLVNTDRKLKDFITELTQVMGYKNLSFSEQKDLLKMSDHEVINEFQQHIDEIKVYGAYFRAFRDSENLNASYFINEFKKITSVESSEIFTETLIQDRIREYYAGLGKYIEQQSCNEKVYYVDDSSRAHLSYKCRIKLFSAQRPESYELVVSANSAAILFQKSLIMFN